MSDSALAADAARLSEGPPTGSHGLSLLSLRAKGLLALLALAALIAWLVALMLVYRASMEQDFDRLEQTREAGLLAAEMTQAQAMALAEVVNRLGAATSDADDVEAIDRHLSRLDPQWRVLEAAGLGQAAEAQALERARRDWRQQPDRVNLLALRSRLEASLAALDAHRQARQAIAAAQVTRVHERGRAVSLTLSASAAFGTVGVGLVVVLFFARLSADIARLRQRALAVVAGDRREARTLARRDELGDLGQALDAMVSALARSEQGLEMALRQRFHVEKMASLGALAAGVLHEIGNPIAVIDGLAQSMRDEREAGTLRYREPLSDPDLILAETTRLREITRKIAELAAAPSREEALLSLNDLVRSALLQARFDPRLAGVAIRTKLEAQLPAVRGVGSLLLLVVTDLLVHAAEASLLTAARGSQVVIGTGFDAAQVQLTVSDSGQGVQPEAMAAALDLSVTGGASVLSPGVALATSAHIARRHGGDLRVDARPGGGTAVTLSLPLPAAQA